MRIRRFLALSLFCGGILAGAEAAADVTLPPPPFGLSDVRTGPVADQRVAWWRQARLGMFIHFGVYSVLGHGEWAMFSEHIPRNDYAKLADDFHPDPAAPAEWAKVARQSGMKYMVLTARHHDGFSLFASRANDFNVATHNNGQDVVKNYTDAARREGLRVGLYYSPLDWRFPGYFMPDLYLDSAEAMRNQYHREVEQLATDYGKIDLLWYDGGGEQWLGFGGLEFDGAKWGSRDRGKPYTGRFSWRDGEVDQRLHQLQPDILVNDRTSVPGDWRTRENPVNLGGFDDVQPWELCITLAGTWGYQPGARPRSLDELVRLLVQTATRDGNLLVNVGPAPDGHIPPDQIARLGELGAWLQKYGRAIYGTRGGPFLPTATMGATRVDSTVFLHLLGGEGDHLPTIITVPEFPGGPTLLRARLVGTGASLTVSKGKGGTDIGIPPQAARNGIAIVELSYDGPVMGLAPRPL
ncbi:alpha-L-fucosidase [Nitrospirillum bahiense]|uniref:alpha-L-fucosidase n=1 Tax=Nitrospirillum amazonense TaxID=28077 RepID=A0A560GA92_9PROT|nr:alpha-L-fucosidase [Nitrospirillum amazonense]